MIGHTCWLSLNWAFIMTCYQANFNQSKKRSIYKYVFALVYWIISTVLRNILRLEIDLYCLKRCTFIWTFKNSTVISLLEYITRRIKCGQYFNVQFIVGRNLRSLLFGIEKNPVKDTVLIVFRRFKNGNTTA